MTSPPLHSEHVTLLAGYRSDGQPVYEEVPARGNSDGTWELLGTPGHATGCAAGDRLAISPDGSFSVQSRGGNLAVLSYAAADGVPDTAVEALREAFTGLCASVEVPPDRRFVVVTVPALVGFAAVEGRMQEWSHATGQDWHFGNVYDENDRPLNWWT